MIQPPRVALVTNMPSYHQIDLFNAIAAEGRFPFRVYYLRRITPGRQWTRLGREIQHDCVFVKELPIHPYFYLNWGFGNALRSHEPDLYIVTQYASIAMQRLMWEATLRRRPWVFWSEAGGIEFAEQPIVRQEWLRRGLRALALLPLRRGPTEVWGVGSRGVDYYRARTQRPVRRFSYVADLARFLAIRRGPVTSPVRFVFAGKLNVRKGADVLVQAARALCQRGLAFDLTVIGDGPLRPDVERLAADHPSRVHYLGFVELDQIPGILAQADVLLCPSRFDGWGMVVLEAMAAGLPVISTTATTAAVDLLAGETAGWLTPPGDVDALADAMADAIQCAGTLRARGERSRELSREYDASRGAARFCEYVEALWSGGAAP